MNATRVELAYSFLPGKKAPVLMNHSRKKEWENSAR
jgi:hypothetical protein